ncbi:MAG: hypothetical protein JWL77_6240 [Chthonomonadaceae bacterium]|nr:hypothetical protein [Chthonomonadaceae bacterium]
MDETIDTQSVIAVLRSDAPWPILHLWDALIDRDIVAEYPEYTQRITLNAYMQGEMGASRSSITLDVEELVGLITSLRELVNLRTLRSDWQAHYQKVELHLSVQMQKMGPPVVCDIWLRDAISVQEEHHCCFETNLTWAALFLAELEHLAFRYREARVLLDKS